MPDPPALQGAWSRTAVIAGVATVLILMALLAFVGVPSSEGVGRVVGLNLFPYVVTALIARKRPRLLRWGPLSALYAALFVAFLFVNRLGAMSS